MSVPRRATSSASAVPTWSDKDQARFLDPKDQRSAHDCSVRISWNGTSSSAHSAHSFCARHSSRWRWVTGRILRVTVARAMPFAGRLRCYNTLEFPARWSSGRLHVGVAAQSGRPGKSSRRIQRGPAGTSLGGAQPDRAELSGRDRFFGQPHPRPESGDLPRRPAPTAIGAGISTG